MSKKREVIKVSSQVKKCALCNQKEEFPRQDPLRYLCVHEICLELLAYSLPSKAGKILLKALRTVTTNE
jgi:hypothetical protein